MCSKCGRLLVGVGDFCPYCGFPRPKLTEALDTTGQIPRVRKLGGATPGVIARRVLGVLLALACVAGLIAAGLILFQPAEARLAGDVTSGVVPDQPNPPDASWSKPRAELFPGLDPNASVTYIEPGRTDAKYAAHLLATASEKSGRSQLISVNLIDGSVRWRVSAGTPFRCADRIVGGGVACLFDAQLRILQLDSGVVARTFTAHITSRAVTVVGTHLVAISGAAIGNDQATVNVQSFAPTGELEWAATHTTKGVGFGLARAGGLILVTGVTNLDGASIVHRAEDGSTVPLPPGRATLLPRDRVAVTDGDKSVLFDGTGARIGDLGGRPITYWPRDRSLESAPMIVLNAAPQTQEGQLIAHSEEGNKLWSRTSPTSVYIGYCSERLVVREPMKLFVLSPGEGDEAWSLSVAGKQPVWCDGSRAITLVDNTTLAAFKIDSGKEEWRLQLGSDDAAQSLMATTQGFLAAGPTWVMYK